MLSLGRAGDISPRGPWHPHGAYVDAAHSSLMFVAAPVNRSVRCDIVSTPTERLPDVVRKARERAGASARHLDIQVSFEDAEPTARVRVKRDTLARAQGVTANGEYFLYLAVHAIPDRKKNVFIGVSCDPVQEVYNHNHGRGDAMERREQTASGDGKRHSSQKEAHTAAPYLSLASAIGPLLTRSVAESGAKFWETRIRGVKSKYTRGHALAALYGVPYYGTDVPVSPRSIATYLNSHVAPGAAEILDEMRAAVRAARAEKENLPETGSTEDEERPAAAPRMRVFTADDLFLGLAFSDATDHVLFTERSPPIVFCV